MSSESAAREKLLASTTLVNTCMAWSRSIFPLVECLTTTGWVRAVAAQSALFGLAELCCRIIGIYSERCRRENSAHRIIGRGARARIGASALVVSVAYSLAPEFPFPAAPEDAYRAALWAVANARVRGADERRIGVAGHDAGGNLATCLALIARDRGESHRLGGLPPALIASAAHDVLHVEAEQYACELIAAGVPTQVTRHGGASHAGLATHPAALAEVAGFFRQRLVHP
jgi:hypothetical protein